MKQSITISNILNHINQALQNRDYQNPEAMEALCRNMMFDLTSLLNDDIDFKAVVDALDDSILITDSESRVIYVNPNYKNNTGIQPDQILGKKVSDIVKEGRLFTGGAVLDVLKSGKKAFRLSTVNVKNTPETGYVIGVPLLTPAGNVKQVVASSRPIFSLQALQEDFGKFLQEANALKSKEDNTRIFSDADSALMNSSRLIGRSDALKAIWHTLEKVAPSNGTILITGESGVGKEIVADEIYRMSSRSQKPFIKVNCASIPLTLLESELFGYEKGAFSGANINGKQGLFELANGGTLLLDEIGDMPIDLQAKLLRAIQNKEITRVGGTKKINLDIRFIAATNSNLREKIREGQFRQDLFYRLNVIPISIPPLRERKEDIQPLCKHFIEYYGKERGHQLMLTPSNYKILESHDWPGNVRELENVIEYLTICSSPSGSIDDSVIYGIMDMKQEDSYSFGNIRSLEDAVAAYERQLIESVLQSSRSLREAGTKLGINASTVSRKIKQYGIDYPHAR